MTFFEPKWGQDGQSWPLEGSQDYNIRIHLIIAACFGAHLGAILVHLGVSGAHLGVSEGALGQEFEVKLNLRITCCELGK